MAGRGQRGRSSVRWFLALAAVGGLVLGACGSSKNDSSSTTTAAGGATTTAGGATTTAGGATTSSGGAAKTELRVATSMADLATLDPPRAFADINGLLQQMYGEALVTVDQKDPTKILPGAAESWEISADGLTYTFKLREGQKFSSGNPVTADDVVFSFERLKNLQGPVAFVLDGMKAITAVDPNTVKIELTAPDSAFLAKVTNGSLMVLDSKVLKENGAVSDATAKDADKAQAYLDANSAGSGPYKLKEWKRNERVVFVPNENYTGTGKPAFETVTFLDVREPATQRQLLEGGDADLATNLDADTAKGAAGDKVKVDTVPSLNLIYLALNNKADTGSPFADPKVRQAVQKAIDYEGISALTGDSKRPAANIPLGLQGIKDVALPERDVEGAKALLKEAGKEKLQYEVTFANYAPYGVPLTTLWEKLKADLAEVGIDITLKPVEYDAWLQAYRTGTLPMTSSIWAPDWLDVTNYLDVFAQPEGLVTKRIGMNVPELGTLFKDVVATTDTAKRDDLAKQSATIMRDDASLIPVVQPNSIIAYRTDVADVAYSPNRQIDILAIKPA